MARQKFGVSLGRPKMPAIAKMPKIAKASASPMDAFKPAVPASAFRKGGKVSYHDDPAMCSGGKPRGK